MPRPSRNSRERSAPTKSNSKNKQQSRKRAEIVVVTGISGSGKVTALKVFEDLGYYCVDNLPVELIPNFSELVKHSRDIERAALVVDVREGAALQTLPNILKDLKNREPITVVFLEASDEVLLRRYSETRRPHPFGADEPVRSALADERRRLRQIRALADVILDTSKFNVHELRAHLKQRFAQSNGAPSNNILVSSMSFGFKHGVPEDADLIFDVRFLPNPHFVPEYRPLTGKHPKVAQYVRSFPQTQEFVQRISELLVYLLPHYVAEGKSYLTIGFGCTGGQHRSVLIARDIAARLSKAGYPVKVTHRDCPR